MGEGNEEVVGGGRWDLSRAAEFCGYDEKRAKGMLISPRDSCTNLHFRSRAKSNYVLSKSPLWSSEWLLEPCRAAMVNPQHHYLAVRSTTTLTIPIPNNIAANADPA